MTCSPLHADQGDQGALDRQECSLRCRPPAPAGRWQCPQDQRTHFPSLTSSELTFLQYDYTKGQLPDLIDVIIEEKAKLFVCAIGVPPKWVVDKLHGAGIIVMNVSAHSQTFLAYPN